MTGSWRAALVLAALFFCGCDTFFEISGTVTRCTDGDRLVGVRARLKLESGGVSDEEDAEGFSKPDGTFYVGLNEPPDVSATLTLDKPGYATHVESFPESPEGSLSFCLDPEPSSP